MSPRAIKKARLEEIFVDTKASFEIFERIKGRLPQIRAIKKTAVCMGKRARRKLKKLLNKKIPQTIPKPSGKINFHSFKIFFILKEIIAIIFS